jgi:hypothetical protein
MQEISCSNCVLLEVNKEGCMIAYKVVASPRGTCAKYSFLIYHLREVGCNLNLETPVVEYHEYEFNETPPDTPGLFVFNTLEHAIHYVSENLHRLRYYSAEIWKCDCENVSPAWTICPKPPTGTLIAQSVWLLNRVALFHQQEE